MSNIETSPNDYYDDSGLECGQYWTTKNKLLQMSKENQDPCFSNYL